MGGAIRNAVATLQTGFELLIGPDEGMPGQLFGAEIGFHILNFTNRRSFQPESGSRVMLYKYDKQGTDHGLVISLNRRRSSIISIIISIPGLHFPARRPC